jgi:excisionase family DNA binding protein
MAKTTKQTRREVFEKALTEICDSFFTSEKDAFENTKEQVVINNNITAPAYYFKEVLSVEETSEYTGLSKGTLYILAQERRIPFYKPLGKKICFKRSELDTFMFRNKLSANYELSEAADAFLNGEKN